MINLSNIPRDLAGNGDIRIIGDRACGKTTFLAALAYLPNHDPQNSAIQSIDPFDPDTAELIDMAENILKVGARLEPTDNPENPGDLPLYTLLIELKPKFTIFPNKNIRIQVSCREYGGELFEELRKISTSKLNEYLNECASASGLLILIDGLSPTKDAQYAQAFKNLESELNMRLTGSNRKLADYRIGVVFTKGEQAQIWSSRNNLSDFVSRKFPNTQITLRTWTRKWGCPIDYFVCSAFGTMGNNPPRPNVKGGNNGVIARPEFWKPFGLVAPIYWLYSGRHDSRLREI